jgi:hypothetical protein
VVYRRAVHHITEEVVSQMYGSRNLGDKRPPKNKNKHRDYFTGEKDSADGYPVDICRVKDQRDFFQFLCPILDPNCPTRVHIYPFNQVYLLLYKNTQVNWTKILYSSHCTSVACRSGTPPPLTCPRSCFTTMIATTL